MKIKNPSRNEAGWNIFELLLVVVLFCPAFLIGHFIANTGKMIAGCLAGAISFILLIQIFEFIARKSSEPQSKKKGQGDMN